MQSTIGERLEQGFYSKKHYAPSNIINGPQIKRLREEKGWSVAELAKRTDLTPENLERIERSDGNTSTGKIRALANELEIHPAMLITGIEELIAPQEVAVSKEEAEALAFHPNRDVTLIRTFAGEEQAFLQIGALKTEIPDEILGDILHVVAVYKLRAKK